MPQNVIPVLGAVATGAADRPSYVASDVHLKVLSKLKTTAKGLVTAEPPAVVRQLQECLHLRRDLLFALSAASQADVVIRITVVLNVQPLLLLLRPGQAKVATANVPYEVRAVLGYVGRRAAFVDAAISTVAAAAGRSAVNVTLGVG